MATEPHLYQSDGPLHRNCRSDCANDRRCRQNLRGSQRYRLRRWQFKTFAEAKAQDAALFAAWFANPQLVRFPNGESLQDLAARTANALRMVLARHRDETVVLGGHDSVNSALLLELLGQPLSAYWRLAQDPCCINEIDANEAAVRVRSINETQHLEVIAAEHDAQ